MTDGQEDPCNEKVISNIASIFHEAGGKVEVKGDEVV